MNTRPLQTAFLTGLLLAGSGCVPGISEPQDELPRVEVTGTGQVRTPQVTFTVTVSVVRRYNRPSGSVLYSGRYADGREVHFTVWTQCLKWEGNSVWIGGMVDISSDPTRAPAGERVMILIRDLGGPGQDIMHAGLVPYTGECVPLNALPETVVSEGNYTLTRL